MAGYVYRGTQFDVPTELKPRVRRAFDPTACGSRRGYKQHQRFNEPACRECKDAAAARMAEIRLAALDREDKTKFNPDKCGTVAGYSAHRHYGVPLDDACRKANADRCRESREKKKQRK